MGIINHPGNSDAQVAYLKSESRMHLSVAAETFQPILNALIQGASKST